MQGTTLNLRHDTFFKVMEGFDAVIVRCNPGQINAAGGDQMSLGQNTLGTVPTLQLLDNIYIRDIVRLDGPFSLRKK